MVIKSTKANEMTILQIERLAKKFKIDDNNCWIWKAPTKSGYGRYVMFGRSNPAHRMMFELINNGSDLSLQLDHLCRVRSCINPAHLEETTARVNVLRGNTIAAYHAKKTHCINGHEFSGYNLIIRWRSSTNITERRCRTCLNIYKLKYDRKRRAKPIETLRPIRRMYES